MAKAIGKKIDEMATRHYVTEAIYSSASENFPICPAGRRTQQARFPKGGVRAAQIAMAREIDRVMVVGRPDQILLKERGLEGEMG